MQVYELEQRLPSCKVEKDLLLDIERYLFEQAQQVFGLSEESVRSQYSLIIDESLGTERLSSVIELRNSKFSDATASIRMELAAWQPRVHLNVYFHRDSFHSRIEAKAEGTQAREKVFGFYNGVLRLLESRRSTAWFFHPPPTIDGILWILTLMSLGAALPLGVLTEDPGLVSGVFIAGPLALLTYHVGGRFNPYTVFASRRSEILEKTWRFFFGGMASFIIFGTLLGALRKKLLGF